MNASYAVVIRAMFAQLERMAGPDVKHGDRLRLENYTLLETELPALANKVHPRHTPCTYAYVYLVLMHHH